MGLQSTPLPRDLSILEQLLRLPGEAAASKQQSPSDVLLDVRLSLRLMEVLSPPLENLGFGIGVDHLPRRIKQPEYYPRRRHFNVIEKGAQQYILFYVPGWILANPSPSNYDAVSGLLRGLEECTTFFILSDEKEEMLAYWEAKDRGEKDTHFPADAFQWLMKEIWPQEKRINAIFVPWSELRELERATTQQDQERVLRAMFKLEELSQSAPAAPPRSDISRGQRPQPSERSEGMSTKLLQDEIIALQEIIARLPEFAQGDTRDRRTVLVSAGLEDVAPGLDLSGAPWPVAGALVSGVENHGSLGVLLKSILKRPHLPPKDAASIARLIVECSLVEDLDYIRELREEYDLGDIVVRDPGSTPHPPTPEMDYASGKYVRWLRETLVDRFSREDVRTLCFDLDTLPGLNVDYDDLAGGGKADKVVSLIRHLEDRERIADLVKVGRELRSDIPWDKPW